jgi:two-component system, OmpR family, sensor histidine kinase KdpD
VRARWQELSRRLGGDRRARLVLAVAVFVVTTFGVWALELAVGIEDASPLYLVAVVAAASLVGTVGGVATALAAVVVYDFLFVEPRLTFLVASSQEWLDLLLFLFVAVVVGQLVGLAADRAETARTYALEAESLAQISRELATRPLGDALPAFAARLATNLGLERVWIELEEPTSHIVADTKPGLPMPRGGRVETLVRGDSSRWIVSRANDARQTDGPSTQRRSRQPTTLRVRLERDDRQIGTLGAATTRGVAAWAPRLLGLGADLVALAVERDRLAGAQVEAEMARQSDALKTRLMTSVSHDLRTPLAAIRAAAGTILDPGVPIDEGRAAAATIDDEADRLDRMVRDLLDLGRVEAGTLHPRLEACDVGALVESSLDRRTALLGGRHVSVSVPPELPPVVVDEVLFDHVLGNLIENVARHASAAAPMRVAASADGASVSVVVEDGGPGLSPTRAARAFGSDADEPTTRTDAQRGVGLAVVRAFAAAMSIVVSAGVSELGGLAVTLRIPTATMPPDESAA